MITFVRTRPVLLALIAAALIAAVAVVVLRPGRDTSAPRSPGTLTGATQVSESAHPGTGALPAPSGPVVLTLRDVPRPNRGSDLVLDRALLDSLGTWRYAVDDRQATGRTTTFQGPLLRTVLEAAGIEDGMIHAAALNDYEIDIPVSDAFRYPVLVATLAEGEQMDVVHYGPTRIIYPTEHYDLDPNVYEPRWIWQLSTMSFS